MCIIVYRPKSAVFPSDEVLARCWEANPDGAGLMYAHKGKLVVQKGFMTLAEFMVAYRTIPDKCPATLHFRIGTHGGKTAANTHPWVVVEKPDGVKLAMVHNGVIHGYGDLEYSDSRDFAENLRVFGERGVFNDSLQRLIHGVIGSNKLVFMHANGDVFTFNEKLGIEEGGCWYSNATFRPRVQITHAQDCRWWDQGEGRNKREDQATKNIVTPQKMNLATVVCVKRIGKVVMLRMASGSLVQYPVIEFLDAYADFDYIPSLSEKIDEIVWQWELDLICEEEAAKAMNRID